MNLDLTVSKFEYFYNLQRKEDSKKFAIVRKLRECEYTTVRGKQGVG